MIRAFTTLALNLVMVTAASADVIDSYSARLSKQDHHNSSGEELNSAIAIIRQDRANFYVFGKIDPEDESDAFFNNKANRARLEKMLSKGFISSEHQDLIVNGTPLITIDIYDDHVKVTIEEE